MNKTYRYLLALLLCSAVRAMDVNDNGNDSVASLQAQLLKLISGEKFFNSLSDSDFDKLAELPLDQEFIGETKHPFWGNCFSKRLDKNKIAVLEGHTDYVSAVGITPENLIVSGSYDKSVRVWDVHAGNSHVLGNHEKLITSVLVYRGTTIISGSFDDMVRLWDLSTGKPQGELNCQSGVYALGTLDDGRIAIESGNVELWDRRQEKAEILTSDISFDHKSLACIGTKLIFIGSKDPTILNVWDTKMNKISGQLQASGEIMAVTIGVDKSIISAGQNIDIWNDNNNKASKTINKARAMAVTQDSQGIIFGARYNGDVFRYNDNKKEFESMDRHSGSVQAIAAGSEGMIVSGGNGNRIHVYDIPLIDQIEQASWADLVPLIRAEPRFKSIDTTK